MFMMNHFIRVIPQNRINFEPMWSTIIRTEYYLLFNLYNDWLCYNSIYAFVIFHKVMEKLINCIFAKSQKSTRFMFDTFVS